MKEVESGVKYMLDFKSPIQGLLGVHSRCGLHTRAVTVFRDPLSEGFRHFVTSMTAPIASGWSGCRVGLAPTGKRRLCTAHTHLGHLKNEPCQPISLGFLPLLHSARSDTSALWFATDWPAFAKPNKSSTCFSRGSTMFGNGPPTGTRQSTKRMRRRRAGFRRTHAADGRMQASIPASRTSGFPARS
jgi:hypothetical protein